MHQYDSMLYLFILRDIVVLPMSTHAVCNRTEVFLSTIPWVLLLTNVTT